MRALECLQLKENISWTWIRTGLIVLSATVQSIKLLYSRTWEVQWVPRLHIKVETSVRVPFQVDFLCLNIVIKRLI